MQSDEKIQAHLVSVWRESKKFLSVGGMEGMLILTDKHLMFVHKTEAKMKWWQAIRQRQVINFLKSKNTMIRHDGYVENNLIKDMENQKNTELSFDEISSISYEEKEWGSILLLEYHKGGKLHKYQYSIAQDWVKYPIKEPTKYMKVDWEPFVQYIKDRQKITK
jgi:predicted RNA-binding protein (virulence factor B family)